MTKQRLKNSFKNSDKETQNIIISMLSANPDQQREIAKAIDGKSKEQMKTSIKNYFERE